MYHLLVFAFLYFIQGLPYGLQSRFLPVYFRTHGMTLTDISFFKLLLTPWMCKALWAPFVDHYKTKKSWLQWSMLGLIITCALGALTTPEIIYPLACVLLFFNLITSIQDIAVDGIAIEMLSSDELGYANIAQVVGYKLGAIFAGGILVWMSEYINWSFLFLSLACVYILSFLFVVTFVPSKSKRIDKISQDKSYDDKTTEDHHESMWILKHLKEVYNSPGTKWTILFVLVYKLGEQGTLSMVPLFLIDKHVSASQVGFWTGVVGQVVSISGSILGGVIPSMRSTSLQTLNKTCILRIAPMILQVLVVWLWHEDSQNSAVLSMVSISAMMVMLLISGTVTTATFTMMMQCSKMAPETIQATHYTTLATLEVLGKLSFSVFIGPITDLIGYRYMFFILLLLMVIVVPLFKSCPRCIHEGTTMTVTVNKNS